MCVAWLTKGNLVLIRNATMFYCDRGHLVRYIELIIMGGLHKNKVDLLILIKSAI